MREPSPALKSLLFELRQHAAFKELLAAVESPPVPRFRPSEAEKVETARANWIYRSGRRDQHDAWLHFLTGEIPRDSEGD